MEGQEVSGRSGGIGWRAAMEAERIRIAARVLPIMSAVSFMVTVWSIPVYFWLGQPWQWMWMMVEFAQAAVLCTLAYLLIRRGHLAAAIYLTTLAISLILFIGPAVVEGAMVSAVFAAFVALIFARLMVSRAQNRVVGFIVGTCLMIGILFSNFAVFEKLPVSPAFQTGITITAAILVLFLTALILDSRDARYEDSLAQAEAYATELDAHRAALEVRSRELEATTDELARGNDVLQAEIAERKRAERESQARRMYLEGVLRAAPDAIVTLDAHHRVVEWNPGAERLFGYSCEEVMGQDIDDLVTNADTFEEAVGFTQMVTGGKALPPVETVRCRKDGSVVDVIVAGSPILVGDELIGVVVVYSDITERKRAEEALRDEKALMDALMDNIPDSIYFKDTACRFTRINRAQAQVLGVSDPEEAIGKTDFEFFDAELARDAYADEQEIVRSGQPLIGKVEKARTADGEIHWFSATKVPIVDKEGRVSGLVGISRDITPRVQMEERLQRYAAELEQANEEVKHFAYIVSHDLRAPLINLKGFAAELRSSLEVVNTAVKAALPHLDEEQQRDVAFAVQEDVPEALGFIDSSVTRMDRFIRALLKLSRLGRRELHPEPLDMEALVQATLQALAHQIEEHQVKVSVGPLPQVVADRTSMEQIMGNILGNAVKYLDPSRPGEIEITAEGGDDEITFHIRDNGRGIAEEDMEKVFAPFRRAGRQDVPGEGMGLAYVQALVRRHGGRIWCESELGVGTTFTFTLPLTV